MPGMRVPRPDEIGPRPQSTRRVWRHFGRGRPVGRSGHLRGLVELIRQRLRTLDALPWAGHGVGQQIVAQRPAESSARPSRPRSVTRSRSCSRTTRRSRRASTRTASSTPRPERVPPTPTAPAAPTRPTTRLQPAIRTPTTGRFPSEQARARWKAARRCGCTTRTSTRPATPSRSGARPARCGSPRRFRRSARTPRG